MYVKLSRHGRHSRQGRQARRGVVLLIVLALLGLFAALAVSFAIMARSEGNGATQFKRGYQRLDGPASRELLTSALDQLLLDTTNPYSAMRGHSLAADMFGRPDTGVLVSPGVVRPAGLGSELRLNASGGTIRPYYGAFNGTGHFLPRMTYAPGSGPVQGAIGNGALSTTEIVDHLGRLHVPREFGFGMSSDVAAYGAANVANYFPFLPHNFQRFDAIGLRQATAPMGGQSGNATSGTGIFPEPELYAQAFQGNTTYHWFPYDEDYDAADHNNWFLALERADGTVIQPSFHRGLMVRQLELAGVFGNATPYPAYQSNAAENEAGATPIVSGRRVIFRPRQVDVDANTVMGTGLPPNFPTMRDLNNNGVIGDIPEELDVDTDGDGKPDSIWMDLGTPPFRNADGELVKPLYAFKVVGLDGRINANLAGNLIADQTNPLPNPTQQVGVPGRPEGHVSAFGASPSEVNPRHAQILDENHQATAGNPAYDGTRGPYWPVWIQPNPAAGAAYLDPVYLRRLLLGLPGAGVQPAVSGRWNNPNVAAANANLDRTGNANLDDNADLLTQFNANIPTEPTTGTPTIVRGTVSSSLGPVNFQGGKRFPPFTKRARFLGATPGSVFPKFVNHLHASGTAMTPYWSGWANPPTNHTPLTNPDLSPGSGTGEFDIPGSHDIPAATLAFDLSDFGVGPSTFALPTAANNWHAIPGQLASNNANFPTLVAALQLLMTRDEANEYNPYSPSAQDSPFNFAQLERMLRNSDLDGSYLDDRLLRLVTFNTGNELEQTASTPYQFNAVHAARDRMRRMFTPESWDLINYSLPPTYGDQANRLRNVAGTINAAPYAPAATMAPSKNPGLADDATVYADNPGTYGVFTTSNGRAQHNGFLWRPEVAAGGDPELPLGLAFNGIDPYAALLDAGGTRAALVQAKELMGRFPVEVLRGRRYDLNRPLTSFESRPEIAEIERTAMAEQIYVLLYLSAGLNSRPRPANVEEAREAFAQARTLAQLAVNIVDYIDPDTVMTRMRFHPFLAITDATGNSQALTQWNAIETGLGTDTVPFTFAPDATTLTSTKAELEVVGFEMPDLVIGEGVSVTFEHPSNMGGPGDREVTLVWTELQNPWPNDTDLDSGAANTLPPMPRGRLYDAAQAPYRVNPQSRFVLGVRQNNAATVGNQAPQRPVAGGNFNATTTGYVHFAATGAAGVTIADGTFTTPRNLANNGPDIRGGQRLLVEPARYADAPGGGANGNDDSDPAALLPDPGSPTTFWQPGVGPNRYTCSQLPNTTEGFDDVGVGDLRFTRLRPTVKDANDANAVVSLYRVRNPYLDWDAAANSYIAIDTLELRGDAAAGQANAEGAYDLSKSSPPTPDNRRSMERKEAWHGCNRPWMPYRGIAAMTTLLDTVPTPQRFLEGKFLGFPYLTADATVGVPNPSMTTLPYGNQLRTNGFARSVNATRGNTLYSDNENVATTTVAVNRTATRNTQDVSDPNSPTPGRYLSFPFLNRQLATPLELLSVRLYGSHPWKVPGSVAGANEVEWRMRFTDDYEFHQDTHNAQTAPEYPALPAGGFNRIYRSRETPWYLNDRSLHPIDPTATTYNPQTSTTAMAPFPNLYRFFEFVECHSRVNGAGGWATVAASTGPGGIADLRQSRVAGKIWGNGVADEEIFKALLDTEEAMALALNESKTPFSPNVPNPPVPLDTTFAGLRHRPVNYPFDVSDSNYTRGLVRGLAWDPSADMSELSLSGIFDTATNQSFVASGAPGSQAPIDFGGRLTTTNSAGAPYVDLSPTNLNALGVTDMSGPGVRLLIHNQFPGLLNGWRGYNNAGAFGASLYPGWNREVQVSSEMFRQFIFSRNGRDGLAGTADDKPFRGFSSAYLSDTLLRRRNYAYLDFPRDGNLASTASTPFPGNMSFLSHGTINTNGAPGEYITRLGGQWTPRLFDPVPMPYVLDGNPGSTAAIAPANTLTMAHRADVAADVDAGGASVQPRAVEYWTLEWRRNELLAKIAANTTARSNVYGVWLTVGYFRVEQGAENLNVPLLHEEVGSPQGKQVRHRMFSIVDRTQLREYTPQMISSPPKLEDNPMVRHATFIE